MATQKWSRLSERDLDVWDGAGIGLDSAGAKPRQGFSSFLMEFAAWLGSVPLLIPRRFPRILVRFKWTLNALIWEDSASVSSAFPIFFGEKGE